METIILRQACPEDAGAVLEIYAPYIRNTNITFEYEVPSLPEFRERMEGIMEGYPYLVCEIDGVMAGYAYAHRYKERAAYQWDAELSVYLRKENARRGIGRAFYTALMEILKEQHVRNVYGIVTSPNPPSEALHAAMGFRLAGVSLKTGYKLGKWIDVSCFERPLGDPDSPPEELLAVGQVPPERIAEILERAAGMIRLKSASPYSIMKKMRLP
ncbi:MAG TPA: GNAT family N-acetyltransferase [Candidatus Eisenbergiella merdipullorum]|uniref:GNAT family N-acetyltransferase n=1 Tax=Candidatus Eisenbergiella merdipullorum TaxID=2838553 RepID=A0A9D2I815_9FIRM|nr:GNAT family N-acetyltransferase [Candidatus Eisenbergiella merdipullorum]